MQENQQGKFVLVVDDENKVAMRIVKLGRRINAMWVVESGLEAVNIIEGLQKVRQGAEVKAVEKMSMKQPALFLAKLTLRVRYDQ